MKKTEVITKKSVSLYFERPFRWIRNNLLTDKVLIDDLGFDLEQFKKWRSFPPLEGNRLKKWIKDHDL